ncbi:MAG: HAD family hydrolase [Polyangiaceae bacterium]|nr:HAD family hydrolase [Polyangiaceae bacterium]
MQKERYAVVVLFDIDGTLVDCGGAGRRAMQGAFAERHGRADACDRIAFSGMTDRAIVRAGLEAIGVGTDEAEIDEVIVVYLQVLGRELPHAASFRVLDGARELSEHSRTLGLEVGLGTGNVRAGARAKLERARLWELFDFGGFGCDAEARDVVLGVGRERGARRSGRDPSRCPTLIVGDTPRDVVAAHAIGARCLAVATGRFDRGALEAAGADIVVDSLAGAHAKRAVEAFSEGA